MPVRLVGLALLSATCLAAALFGGCALFKPHVADLTFTSIARATDAKKSDGRMLTLRFTTERDLIELGKDTTYLDASLCPFTRNPSLSVGTLDQIGRDVREYRPQNGGLPAAESSLHEYEATIFYDYQTSFNPTTHGFDRLPLPSEPVDLCFSVSSPSYLDMGGFDSNVAVIPKEALARALNGKP